MTRGERLTQKSKSSRCTSELLDQEKIHKKAYELYKKRGYAHGNDWADWLEAEKLVVSESSGK